ncbi:hypothetical protein [Leifsonia sp. EB34]|uniref:hypothetical protein n=1 Tax=Leifsonia sp. EB34 TaxID=3156303 RepID=UPI003512D3C2
MRQESSLDGVRAARSMGVAYCVIGVAGAAYAAIYRPDTTALAAFRWLLLACCLGFLTVGTVLLVLATLRTPSTGVDMPSWIRPAAIGGGVLMCLGLLGVLFSLVSHPALWVVVASIASIMLSLELFGLTAGVYRIHGGKRVE